LTCTAFGLLVMVALPEATVPFTGSASACEPLPRISAPARPQAVQRPAPDKAVEPSKGIFARDLKLLARQAAAASFLVGKKLQSMTLILCVG
jgi:hypothetical protein